MIPDHFAKKLALVLSFSLAEAPGVARVFRITRIIDAFFTTWSRILTHN
jgi:hypothetical protein